LGRVWGDFLVDPRVQLIPCDHLWQKLMRQGKQEERFFTTIRPKARIDFSLSVSHMLW
jgi:hypothetical protein